jgi:hypothetical protein
MAEADALIGLMQERIRLENSKEIQILSFLVSECNHLFLKLHLLRLIKQQLRLPTVSHNGDHNVACHFPFCFVGVCSKST